MKLLERRQVTITFDVQSSARLIVSALFENSDAKSSPFTVRQLLVMSAARHFAGFIVIAVLHRRLTLRRLGHLDGSTGDVVDPWDNRR